MMKKNLKCIQLSMSINNSSIVSFGFEKSDDEADTQMQLPVKKGKPQLGGGN